MSVPQLDLVFACDCTGSMGSYIESAKSSIRHIIEAIQASEKRDVQFALVSYRDHQDDYTTKVFPFTSSVKTAKQYVDTMSASGGGDTPEAVADAMNDILNLPYRKGSLRICVFVTDAPPHGINCNGDNHPNGSPNGHDPIVIAHKMAQSEIVVYCVACEPGLSSSSTASSDFFRAVAEITGGRYVPLGNARALPDVIIGGAEEELNLEKLRQEIEKETAEVERSMASKGPVNSEEVYRNVTANLQKRGVCTTNLMMDDIGEQTGVTDIAKKIAACQTLAEVRKLLGTVSPPPRKAIVPFYSAPSADYASPYLCATPSAPGAPPPAPSSYTSAPTSAYASQKAWSAESEISYEQVSRVMKRAQNKK